MNFVAIADHTPAQCPGSNKEIFDRITSIMPKVAELEQKNQVTISGIHVMLGAHKLVMIMDAPSFEAAEMQLWDSGMLTWNTVQIYQTYGPAEAMAINKDYLDSHDEA